MQVYGERSASLEDGEPERADLCDKQRSGRTMTATDEFHKIRFDELIKGNRRIT
jgi:hypothetical protein